MSEPNWTTKDLSIQLLEEDWETIERFIEEKDLGQSLEEFLEDTLTDEAIELRETLEEENKSIKEQIEEQIPDRFEVKTGVEGFDAVIQGDHLAYGVNDTPDNSPVEQQVENFLLKEEKFAKE